MRKRHAIGLPILAGVLVGASDSETRDLTADFFYSARFLPTHIWHVNDTICSFDKANSNITLNDVSGDNMSQDNTETVDVKEVYPNHYRGTLSTGEHSINYTTDQHFLGNKCFSQRDMPLGLSGATIQKRFTIEM